MEKRTFIFIVDKELKTSFTFEDVMNIAFLRVAEVKLNQEEKEKISDKEAKKLFFDYQSKVKENIKTGETKEGDLFLSFDLEM